MNLNKKIAYTIENNDEVYHHEGRSLLFVADNGLMVHISRVKQIFGIETYDLINQASTRDYMEANLLLIPVDMKLAIFEYEIDHNEKIVKNKFTLNSKCSDILELIKNNNEEGSYKDYKQEQEFFIAESDDIFYCSEIDLENLFKDFDYSASEESEGELTKLIKKYEVETPFVENYKELLSFNFTLDMFNDKKDIVEEKTKNEIIDDKNIPF